MLAWLKANKWYVVAYVVFIVLFWFIGKPHLMNPVTAYFGLVALHVVFAFLVWVVRRIVK